MLGKIFSLDAVYALTGVVLCIFAWLTFTDTEHPRRWGSGAFWLILGFIFLFGGLVPRWAVGCLVLVMVVLDGAGQVRGEPAHHTKRATRSIGDRIFLPVLLVPVVTFGFAAAFRLLGLDANRGALVGLGFGGVAAMLAAARLTHSGARLLFDDGRRLNETMGAVNILPQLLASLGIIFTAAGVGELIAGAIARAVPSDNLFLLVLANCLAMAAFTVVMGNSFAAFPVIATGVLVPLILRPFGVDPAMAAILTLTAGSSGTLMTPMAANFNIVPAALLTMKDQYGVIRFQLPYAAAILTAHVVVLWGLAAWMR